MTKKTTFNMDTKLKKKALEMARKDGLSLSAMLNMLVRGYVEKRIKRSLFDIDMEKGLDDIRNGRFVTLEELEREIYSRRKV